SIRVEPLEVAAVPSIPAGDIEPFLTHPLISGTPGLPNAAQIVAGRDQHVVRGERDVVYAAGIEPTAGNLWYIYRPNRTFRSPDAEDLRAFPEKNVFVRWLQRPPLVRLPEERTGLVFVFQVFDRVSYALVLQTTDPITVGNYVRNP